jgi:ATP-dependent Clp protease protease subunit
MIHEVTSGVIGKVADMEDSIGEAKRINKVLFDIIKKETKISPSLLDDIYIKKKDWFFTAEEALEMGLITEII